LKYGFEAPDVAVIIRENGDVHEPAFEQVVLEYFSLFATQFEEKRSARSNESGTFSNDALKTIDTIGAAVVGEGGFEDECVAWQGTHARSGDVGNDAHDDVDSTLKVAWNWREEVAAIDLHPVR
jgi:hypothetical protein